jgi:hypothetical protein
MRSTDDFAGVIGPLKGERENNAIKRSRNELLQRGKISNHYLASAAFTYGCRKILLFESVRPFVEKR